METLRFKTSLKCGGCVKAITPWISNITEIKSWNVDLESPDRILSVESTEDISEIVIENIKKAGYEASRLE
jgi:copper chaperone CopZ